LLHRPPTLFHGKVLMSSFVAMLKKYSYSTVLCLFDQGKYYCLLYSFKKLLCLFKQVCRVLTLGVIIVSLWALLQCYCHATISFPSRYNHFRHRNCVTSGTAAA
jgi:hypothetical protein